MSDAADPAEARARAEVTLALAHALRTPLTSLALGLGLLEEGALGALTGAQRDVVHALVRDAARLSLLVDHALQTDRLGAYAGPIERAAVDLGALLRDAAAPIAAQALEKGVRVELALPPGVTVVVDPVKLAWVVTSLLGNALRFTPPGETVELRLAAARGEAKVRIRDRGPGLPPALRAGIFERESGRGLFLAREIVEAHGGRIGVRPTAGRGCTFLVALPLAGGALARKAAQDDQEG